MYTVPILAEVPADHRSATPPSDTAILQMFGQAQGIFRRQQFGLVPAWNWADCLARCGQAVAMLDRDHLLTLLKRNTDQAFCQAVLARYDGAPVAAAPVVYLWEWASALDRSRPDTRLPA